MPEIFGNFDFENADSEKASSLETKDGQINRTEEWGPSLVQFLQAASSSDAGLRYGLDIDYSGANKEGLAAISQGEAPALVQGFYDSGQLKSVHARMPGSNMDIYVNGSALVDLMTLLGLSTES